MSILFPTENQPVAWFVCVVVICVCIVSTSAIAAAIGLRNRPSIRHWILFSALSCALISPVLVAGFLSSGLSLLVLPWASHDRVEITTEDKETRTSKDPGIAVIAPPANSPSEFASNSVEYRQAKKADAGTPSGDINDRAKAIPKPREMPAVVRIESGDLIRATVVSSSYLTSRVTTFQTTAIMIWLTGLSVLVAGCLRSWWRLRRVLLSLHAIDGIDSAVADARNRLRLDALPAVNGSKFTHAPFVTGWCRPVIVLPLTAIDELSTAQLADVLVHETAHVLRRDQLVVWLQQLAKCVFWPIIPIHLLNRRLAQAREEVCDNYVMAQRDSVSYGETLLKVAQLSTCATSPSAAMGILHWKGTLEDRITGLLNGSRHPETRPQGLAAVAVFVTLFSVSLLLCGTTVVTAQDQRKPSEPNIVKATNDAKKTQPFVERPMVLGRVTTVDNASVAAAKVFLIGGTFQNPKVLGETVSDGEGQFEFTDLPPANEVFSSPGLLKVWAEHPDLGLGFFANMYNKKGQPIDVKISAVGDFRGRMLDSAGKPIVGANVEATRFFAGQLNESGSRHVSLVEKQRQLRSAVTDANGSYVISRMPRFGSIELEVTAVGFGCSTIHCNTDLKTPVKLAKTGALAGQVTWPEDVAMPPDIELGSVSLSKGTLFNGVEFASDRRLATHYVRSVDTVSIKNDGSFSSENLSAGTYFAQLQLKSNVPLLTQKSVDPSSFDPGPTCTITAGEKTTLSLTAEKALRISGRVVGLIDEKPVPNATVKIFPIINGGHHHGPQVKTNIDGEYVAFVRAGFYLLKVIEVPEGYVPLEADTGYGDGEAKTRIVQRKVEGDFTWPDLLLDPSGDVTLEIVDEQGEPIPRAVISIITPSGYAPQNDYQTLKRSDANGRYIVRRVALNDTLPIRVASTVGISDPKLVVTPGELEGPVRVTLSKTNGFYIRCQVVDEAGTPIAGARIFAGTTIPYVTKWFKGISMSGHGGGATATADPEGVAVIGPLWADRPYRVSVSAKGYARANSPYTRGEKGETVDLDKFTLAKVQLPVSGVVKDSAGRPLSGARVSAAGKQRNPLTVVTDADGRFSLKDVADHVHYVFADLNGYRLSGIRLKEAQTSAEIVLHSTDSPAKNGRRIFWPTQKTQFEKAKNLIEQAWTLPMHPRSTSRIDPLKAMVRINPTRAYIMSQNAGGHFDYLVNAALAEHIIDEDPDEALALLEKTKNWLAFNTAVSLAKRFAVSNDPSHQKAARRLTELLETIAKKEKSPGYFASLAQVLTLLGEHEKAKAFIETALAVKDQKPGQSIGAAAALAVYDFERAKGIVAKIEDDRHRSQGLARVALAIAAKDPDRAVREIETYEGEINLSRMRDRSRLKVALAIVDSDREKAIALVRKSEEPDNLAQALGHLAVAVGRTNMPQAWQLIDEALAIHRNNTDAFQSWGNYGAAGPFAAALACQAKMVNYPDMESVVWHVRLACRLTGSVNDSQRRLVATIGTARILAMVDQFASRELLLLVEPDRNQIPRGAGGVSLYDQWLQAWLLTDFGRGVGLLREDLERAVATGENNPLRYGHGAVFRLLTATPEEQFSLITANETGIWKLDDE